MKAVGELFEAKASNVWDTMTSHSNTAGYRIPNYQRTYDWSDEKISRLMDDCLNGFFYLSQGQRSDSFTFLGTLILVREKNKETSFDGTSLSVVDGQQRLTTLVLMMCSLIEEISAQSHIIPTLPPDVRDWIDEETKFQLDCLFTCAIGEQSGRGKKYPYPRIIRDEDHRGRSIRDTEYRSIISKFLVAFSEYYQKELSTFVPPKMDVGAEYTRFIKNYKSIKSKIAGLSDQSKYDEMDCEYLPASNFQKRDVTDLFEKAAILSNGSQKSRALSFVATDDTVEPLVRLLLFASYLTRCVVLTRVETDDEASAFDIFDSLNTTGEPLTALETLKPRVIHFEKALSGYRGSHSEAAFLKIEENLNDVFAVPDDRQKETKELIVSFALYIEGVKRPKNLSSQRSYLRSTYDKLPASPPLARRRFIGAIADMAEFRRYYWDKDGIAKLAHFHKSNNLDKIQLCVKLIADMNTSLALPILSRYWAQFKRNANEEEFLSALKALTAFIVLRRAATGTTSGIDTVFRSLMSKIPSVGGDPLSAGVEHSRTLLDVPSFKRELIRLLAVRSLGVTNKQSWLDKVVEIPLADQSIPLARFLLLAAAHHAAVDDKDVGLWTRDNIRPSDETDYLNFRKWTDGKYSTLEHVAPDSNPVKGWDEAIYRSTYTKHTLGNLVLLPQKENSSVGNVGWPKKKLFYLAMTEKTIDGQQARFNEAQAAGFEFKKKTQKLLSEGDRLQLLNPIRDVEDWSAEFIKKRTNNIANLAWDSVAAWLF